MENTFNQILLILSSYTKCKQVGNKLSYKESIINYSVLFLSFTISFFLPQ